MKVDMMITDHRFASQNYVIYVFSGSTTLFNCRGGGFELCFSNLRSILNHTVEDEEDETVDNKGKT